MAGLLKWVFPPGAIADSLQAGAATPKCRCLYEVFDTNLNKRPTA